MLYYNKNNKEIEKKYEYNLDLNLEDLQKNFQFDSTSKGVITEAIYCFLIINDFEDSIRKAISIGVDSDTIAAIAGSISESYYGIPQSISKKAIEYIPEYMWQVISRFYLKKELNSILKENNLINDEFINYIKPRTKVIPYDSGLEWFGTFAILDDNNDKLKDIRLLVPDLQTKQNLLVNIHEYTHAFQLYCELGNTYVENKKERETFTSNMEKKYLLKRKK